MLADVRRSSGPTTEIIRVSPESLKIYAEAEGKKLNDEFITLDSLDNKGKLFTSFIQVLNQNLVSVYENKLANINNGNGVHSPKLFDRSSPRENSRDRITPDKLPEELGLKEVRLLYHN